jgi:hypothetical protein
MVTVVDVDAGPSAVARRVQVSAPAAEVFALIVNPRHHHELDGSGAMRDVPVLGPERLAVGDSFTVGLQQSGIPYQATLKVTSLEDDKFVEWEDAYGRRWRWELSETDDGTEVTQSMDYSTATMPLFDQMSGDTDRHASAITESLHMLADRFSADEDGAPAHVRPAVCFARWRSPNLKLAG